MHSHAPSSGETQGERDVADDSDVQYGCRVTETWEPVHTPPKAPPSGA